MQTQLVLGIPLGGNKGIMATNELPTRGNQRGGPGWWMDPEGAWRSPEDWPEDTPPLEGWVRTDEGRWQSPLAQAGQLDTEKAGVAPVEAPLRTVSVAPTESTRRSRQAQADRKAILTVAGVVATTLALLVVALVLITQAGAEDIPEPEVEGAVIFAAETDDVRQQRRVEVAAEAPTVARAQLAQLTVRSSQDDLSSFDVVRWTAERTDCVDVSEQVLLERSQQPVRWADQLECVLDGGRWSDRYLNSTIDRVFEADVSPHVPAAIAYISGGADWSQSTRQAYLTDTDHPATLVITAADSGHNPRNQDPSLWRPSQQSIWCAYAIDWVAVKVRWGLNVTTSERVALNEMLDTCGSPESSGADLATTVIDPLAAPTIELVEELAE